MTDEQFRAEKLYQVSLSLAQSTLEKGHITADEFAIIDRILLEKYRPLLGTLFSANRLT
jgi:hypothetical protein